ncbi:MAG: minor capsid protein [Mollicutes bacterium]|nr:minor capsid protein [Mollicutes bacterium]
MAKDVLKVEFPQGKIYVSQGGNGKAYIEYNKSYVNKFNNDLNKTQVFLDNKVIMFLQEYVSYKHGVQAKSIRLTSDAGSGLVHINVPYAEYQAYSKRIKKRVGKRGTYPFERMKADKKDTILKQVEAYSRRLNK